MSKKIPKIIEDYLKASNNNDLTAVLACFTKDATILDEGETLEGHEAIAGWFKKTKKKYAQQTEALSVREDRGEVILNARVTGTFPGSPIELNYRIQLKDGLIRDLGIA